MPRKFTKPDDPEQSKQFIAKEMRGQRWLGPPRDRLYPPPRSRRGCFQAAVLFQLFCPNFSGFPDLIFDT
jgi:hypothetical protein